MVPKCNIDLRIYWTIKDQKMQKVIIYKNSERLAERQRIKKKSPADISEAAGSAGVANGCYCSRGPWAALKILYNKAAKSHQDSVLLDLSQGRGYTSASWVNIAQAAEK